MHYLPRFPKKRPYVRWPRADRPQVLCEYQFLWERRPRRDLRPDTGLPPRRLGAAHRPPAPEGAGGSPISGCQIPARYDSTMIDWSSCPAVERDPGRVSGEWVFHGPRVPVAALFENVRFVGFRRWRASTRPTAKTMSGPRRDLRPQPGLPQNHGRTDIRPRPPGCRWQPAYSGR
jgi:hypothetical protein